MCHLKYLNSHNSITTYITERIVDIKVTWFARAKSGHAQYRLVFVHTSFEAAMTSNVKCRVLARFSRNVPVFSMNLIFFLILQCGLFCLSTPSPRSISGSAALPTARVARRTASQQASVEYTLITLNSPDCGLYPIDKFPVRVQYRLTNSGLSTSGEWISLESMIAKSKYHAARIIMPKLHDNNNIV
jgi:hypothetical protein